ncbi:MAG: hypothetical protein ALECFALPRED_001506 [Alectoria fallacina]|uniref:Glycosyl hydrolase n=1 Tax=Alectoria fallacina TaxID=1903189 RepID=A0A8H3JBB1_9LECA|nr:MAG: hypothetical protein ALECFALPRED_001506 [Alectoria fallacina]
MILRSLSRSSADVQLLVVSLASLSAFAFAIANPGQGNAHSHDEAVAQPSLADSNPLLSERGLPFQHAFSADHNAQFLEGDSQELNTYPSTYTALLNALEIMENHFFAVSHGTWPQAIDWTAAVMGTQVSATLSAMTSYAQKLESLSPLSTDEARDHENLINRYFTQITSFYFGENAFALRTQAYDDMLWVVLGWLETIKFIKLHSSLHYTSSYDNNATWYATQFIPQYAHRARLFYDLASCGWDTSLCGGGMLWNPYLAPYKNAITNQLYIAASISMYLYFPGDSDPSPFLTHTGLPPAKAHDIRYLDNAVEAYKWLKGSNMRNKYGLYVDGFHITGWQGGKNGSNGTGKCDLRHEKVYTYNQGVILSGLKGLWEATGSRAYLEDGHELVRDVITATGWEDKDTEQRYRWAGLGRGGVMEELCDWSGSCSQNGQTFKGIFYHHLTLFCSPLIRREWNEDGGTLLDDEDSRQLHQKSCDEYGDWVRHNALAAYVTRNQDGEFGQWWGRSARRKRHEDEEDEEFEGPSTQGTDYRNEGVPKDEIWRLPDEDDIMYKSDTDRDFGNAQRSRDDIYGSADEVGLLDINDRGRGRTVETQSGGVAILRALWRLVEARQEEG